MPQDKKFRLYIPIIKIILNKTIFKLLIVLYIQDLQETEWFEITEKVTVINRIFYIFNNM